MQEALLQSKEEGATLPQPEESPTQNAEYRRKRIGIMAWKLGENSLGVTLPYFTFFSSCFDADIEILVPNQLEVKPLDLLVLPGGPDVDPNRYAERASFYAQKSDPVREWFDANVLPLYIENRTPIFGICRGHQTLAVHFGGRLLQHMWHETNDDNEREKRVHRVAALGKGGITIFPSVNSMHHQIVSVPPKNAIVSMRYISDDEFKDRKKNGLTTIDSLKENDIEGLIYTDYPAASVQHHPEEIWDEYSQMLIEHLLSGNFDHRFYLRPR